MRQVKRGSFGSTKVQEAIFFPASAGKHWLGLGCYNLGCNSAQKRGAFATISCQADINKSTRFGFFLCGIFLFSLLYLGHNSAPDKKAVVILSYPAGINKGGLCKLQKAIFFSPASAG